MKKYVYSFTDIEYPTSFQRNVSVGQKSISLTFNYPEYLEEERNNLALAVEMRKKVTSLEGADDYDYLEYWLTVGDRIIVDGEIDQEALDEWIEDTSVRHPVRLSSLDAAGKLAFVQDNLGFVGEIIKEKNLYDELLVWDIDIELDGIVINSPINLGGWVKHPEGSFSFKYASDVADRIGKEDLPKFLIYFEVYDE